MTKEQLAKEVEWLKHTDLREFMATSKLSHQGASGWTPLFEVTESPTTRLRWFSALVPAEMIAKLVADERGWDVGPLDGKPSVWTHYHGSEKKTHRYCPFGNEEGLEPLVILRDFNGMKPSFLELAQEFRFYFNLFHDAQRSRYLEINSNGDEIEVVRYTEKKMEVRTNLLVRFAAVKQMAIAIYLESTRYSKPSLEELGLREIRDREKGPLFCAPWCVVASDSILLNEYATWALMVGAKKYVLPSPSPFDDEEAPERYQEFIIGLGEDGELIRYTCDPGKLANYFGANPEAPNYLTPVHFRSEVLAKYYADPLKYSVEDGYLRCGSLWGVRMDNDHEDYITVFLGDVGRDLSEAERDYWISFNIAPVGKGISHTNFMRSFMAQPTDPQRPDLVFKQLYQSFGSEFAKVSGWQFFLPLHQDDHHFLSGLRLLAKDNQVEFDSQLLSLTKVLIDSLNEKEIAKRVAAIEQNEKGISKLGKMLAACGLVEFNGHIKFLRVLQDLRSKSAVHRKGSSYDALVEELQLSDVGQKAVFSGLLASAVEFLKFLQANLELIAKR
jgi:hypothetical protein